MRIDKTNGHICLYRHHIFFTKIKCIFPRSFCIQVFLLRTLPRRRAFSVVLTCYQVPGMYVGVFIRTVCYWCDGTAAVTLLDMAVFLVFELFFSSPTSREYSFSALLSSRHLEVVHCTRSWTPSVLCLLPWGSAALYYYIATGCSHLAQANSQVAGNRYMVYRYKETRKPLLSRKFTWNQQSGIDSQKQPSRNRY